MEGVCCSLIGQIALGVAARLDHVTCSSYFVGSLYNSSFNTMFRKVGNRKF